MEILLSKSFHDIGILLSNIFFEFPKYGFHPEENFISNSNNQSYN